MKKAFIVLGSMAGALFLVLVVHLAAHNITVPGENSAIYKEVKIAAIYEGGVKDIVFQEADGSIYYINRGLEQGFTLDELRAQLLNKTVTLHLTRKLAGVSSHINQLAYEDTIVYSELN